MERRRTHSLWEFEEIEESDKPRKLRETQNSNKPENNV